MVFAPERIFAARVNLCEALVLLCLAKETALYLRPNLFICAGEADDRSSRVGRGRAGVVEDP